MSHPPHVLVVDDDPEMRSTLGRLIGRSGCRVSQAGDTPEGIQSLRDLRPDLVITDLEMPGGSGLRVLDAGISEGVPIVILTAHATVELAVEAMKRGAANFLAKPFTLESVSLVLQDAFAGRPQRSPMRAASPADTRPTEAPATRSWPVGEDEVFLGVLELVRRVADTDVTVLITGESGTGKEVVARAIHAASRRRDRSFVPVNCGAIPDALLESELFGHTRGAFTGATHARRGRFQVAEGGTLFLDEIGDMPVPLQVKLLRVIQERQFEVLGDSRPQTADVRFIAASHRDLRRLVGEGRLREDLYYRLNVVPLHLPPLRQRQHDIPLLAAHFIAEANAAHGRSIRGISAEALEALAGYGWPGNIRELANIVERMVVLRGDGVLQLEDVPARLREQRTQAATRAVGSVDGSPVMLGLPSEGIDLGDAMQQIETVLIEQALSRAQGNRTQAAALLRLNRTTLVEKLRRHQGGDRGD